jgi:hypothetical protein
MKVLFKDQTKDRWLTTGVVGPEDGRFLVGKSFGVVEGKGATVKEGFITLTKAVALGGLAEDLKAFLIQFEAQNTKKLYVEEDWVSPVTGKKKGKVAKTTPEKDEPVAPESGDKIEEAFEKTFWGKLNSFCLGCEKDCKQSSKVQVVQCAQYKKNK